MRRLLKVMIVLVIVAACGGILFYDGILKAVGKKIGSGQGDISVNFGKALSFAGKFISCNDGNIFFRIENKLMDEEEPGRKYRKILFHYNNPKAQKVCISGEFNDWADELMEKKNSGIWEKTKLLLPDIEYIYLFIVDGVSVPDPTNPNSIDLGIRGMASIVPAGADDIHVLAAMSETKFKNADEKKETLLNEKIFVSGIVCDKNGRAISGATIKISRGGKEIERIKTGRDGTFPPVKLDRGKYVFKAWKDKYNTRSITVELGNAPSQRLKFTFTRQ